MPLQETSGAASYDGFGGGVAVVPNYIEDVFSTYLYTGNGSTQTITNSIDLAGKGGLIWTGVRTGGSETFVDTVRGTSSTIFTNRTSAAYTGASDITAFNSTGYSLGYNAGDQNGTSAQTFVGWTFRKQPKFFDVVTYTGDDNSNHVIPHNLGSVPGCIIVKQTSGAGGAWFVRHRSVTNIGRLNLTNSFDLSQAYMYPNLVTDTSFAVNYEINTAGETYVAYIFAHNAGGFGLTGTDNVISCGSFTTDGSGNSPAITLGYEPQWIMCKPSSAVGSWTINDVMRGWSQTGLTFLYANSSAADTDLTGSYFSPSATGTNASTSGGFNPSATYIYIAIRRGPMKVPTDGTNVFAPTLQSASSTPQTKNYGITTDSMLALPRNGAGYSNTWWSRLQGANIRLSTQSTNAESSTPTDALIGFDAQTGVRLGADASSWVQKTVNWVHYPFQRAPSFFDEVCYTGTGATTTYSHNLAAAPELMIIKRRNSSVQGQWRVFYTNYGPTNYGEGVLNTTAAISFTPAYDGSWDLVTKPTTTSFQLLDVSNANLSGATYVAYLFATCPGVSKVFSFTGNGTTQTINCGFAGGARFVLLKASSASGGWYVYDTARGMTTLTDPYLQLNSTAAETATLGSVTTVTTGFAVNEAITTGVNTNGVTYIGLAIA